MLFTRDTKGKLRQFTLDSGDIQDELDQVSSKEGVLALKMLLAKQGIVINNAVPILCLVKGGKLL